MIIETPFFNLSFYGMIYALCFLCFLLIPGKNDVSFAAKLNVAIYAAIGAILGGRLFYVLFYDPSWYLQHLTDIPKIYKGGMSFHGGVFGIAAALYFCARKNFWFYTDKICICALLIIPLGRIANFLNGELWGTPSTLPWAVIFLGADLTPRHPVQIYEAIAEGPLLALLIFIFYKILKTKASSGLITSLYLIGYGSLRFICEFFREPDFQVGYVLFGTISLGQIFCLLTSLLGLIIFKILSALQSKSGSPIAY